MHLKVQALLTGMFLLTEPAFHLFGGMRGSVIQDEGHGVHLPAKGFGNDHLLNSTLYIFQPCG